MRSPAPSGKTAGIILNSDFSFCTSPAPQFPHHRQFRFSDGRHFFAYNTELAQEFGVSLLTADRAVRQLVKAGLVYREQGRGTYVSPNLPESPKKGYRIGIADKLAYPVIPLREAALDIRPRTSMQYLKNCSCEVRILDYEEVRDLQLLKREAASLDGLIVSSAYFDPVTEANLLTLPIPVVINLHEWVMAPSFNQVITDLYPGMKLAAEEIVRRHFPEIVVIYEDHRNGHIRKDSFIRAVEAAGYDKERIHAIQVEEWALQSGVPSYRLAMKLCKDIRGKLLFSTSDVVSFAMLEAFHEAGLKPGEDFQLLSYDNLEGYGYLPFGKPVLTSIDSPKIRIAERSAELLLDKIQHPSDETVIIRLPTTLVVRETAFS